MTQIELARLPGSASWRTPGTAAAEVGGQNGPPFSAMAFVSNDEVYHRIVFFETPDLSSIPINAAMPGCSTSVPEE